MCIVCKYISLYFISFLSKNENELQTGNKRNDNFDLHGKGNLNTSGDNINKDRRESNADAFLKQTTIEEEMVIKQKKELRQSERMFASPNEEEGK